MPVPDYYAVFRDLSRNWVMLAVFFLVVIPSFAQVTVSFPTSRIVFQRSNENNASFVVTGTYKQGIPDRVEAALEPLKEGQGMATDWQLVEQSPTGGLFSGTISATGGWYKLKVRLIRNGQIGESTEIDRIGVGEVFVVAGQSNARGIQNYGAPPAYEDRVSCFNYLNASFEPNELPEPAFSHLNADSYIAPYGFSAWSWGALGDLLVARLNVPVLFYNAALEGTTSRAWRESTTGLATNPYIGGAYSNQLPYSQMRVSLRQFASLTGIRAILWQQGESDTQFELPEPEIVNNLQQVVSQSRYDAGHNISWVMSRVSYNGTGQTKSAVVNAQNTVINSVSNVFNGPYTDDIQIPRPDGVHIQGSGLLSLAEAWNNSLTSDFFKNSNPRGALPLPTIKVGCAGDNQVKLFAQGDYTEMHWNTGVSDKIVTVGSGVYRVKVKDTSGNFLYSPSIEIGEANLQALPKPIQPIITAKGATSFCQGEKVELLAQDATAYRWSNGATSRNIVVEEANSYTVQVQDEKGCWSLASEVITIMVNPVPTAPTVVAKGPVSFCADQTLVLEIEGGSLLSTTNMVEWIGGQKTSTIVVKESGDYAVRVSNQYNCFSPYSKAVSVTVYPLPTQPTITPNGLIRFCEKEAMTLYSNSLQTNIWSNGETSPNLIIRESGRYSVRTLDTWGCLSLPSEEVKVEVSPIPSQPIIEKTGNYLLKAQGNYLSDIQFRWDFGGEQVITKDRFLKGKKTANYTVTAFYFIDQTKTCASLPSFDYNFVLDLSGNGVNVYPNPSSDGVFWVESYDDIKNARLQVINADGQSIYEIQLSNLTNTQMVKTPNLPSGFYTLRIGSSSHATITKKLWVLP